MTSVQYYPNQHRQRIKKSKFFSYHDWLKSTTFISAILGSVSFIAGSGGVNAGDIEFSADGELLVGVSTAEDELLSDGKGDNGYTFFANSELTTKVEANLLEKLRVGAEIVLEADADAFNQDVNADEMFLFVSDGFGLIQAGRLKGAEDAMALGADTIAAGTGGIDGNTENLGAVKIINSADAAKISYFTPRIGGLQFGLSFTPDTGDDDFIVVDTDDNNDEEIDLENHVGLGLNFIHKLGDVDIGLAAVGSFGEVKESDQNDLNAFSLGGTVAFDDVEIGASYGNNNDTEDFDFATIGATFGFGEAKTGIGYNYLDEKAEGVTHIIVLSGDVALLKGIELQADVSYADPPNQPNNIASILALELSF